MSPQARWYTATSPGENVCTECSPAVSDRPAGDLSSGTEQSFVRWEPVWHQCKKRRVNQNPTACQTLGLSSCLYY